MTDGENMQDLIETSEDALLQRIINRQEGALGQEELNRPGPHPTQAELVRWEQALDELDGGTTRRAVPRQKRLGRTALTAILAAAIMLMTAGALSRPFLNWVESVQEQFTQLQARETAENLVAQWEDAYVPEAPPEGFAISDAADFNDMKYIEYDNSNGERIIFYQYSPDFSIRFDTEHADRSVTAWVDGQTAYLFLKGRLATIYWENGDTAFSIEYAPDLISEAEIKAFAEHLQRMP